MRDLSAQIAIVALERGEHVFGIASAERHDVDGGEPQVGKLPRLDETRAITKEDLGTKNIEGILCNGTRQTITIPAGKIGNERPIAIVTDTWFAPSLDVIVQSSTNDPRFGETTYQLRNIQVGRQALTFFEVPPGYRVEHPRQ